MAPAPLYRILLLKSAFLQEKGGLSPLIQMQGPIAEDSREIHVHSEAASRTSPIGASG
jgi:hypothetical protein